MSLRIVLFTRSSRPSGAQMAWRLFQAGRAPVAILVEKRGKMVSAKRRSVWPLLAQHGFGFLWKRVGEAARIRYRYLLRKFLGGRFKDPVYLSIEEWALDHPSVRVYEVEDHNGPQTRELLWRIQPDVGILTNTRRIQKEVLEIPRHGFFNLHLSALPKYAGLDSIFWTLYHGEKEIGMTVHRAAEKIDRGEILLQEKIPVFGFDTEEGLYEKALWLGTSLMVQAIEALEAGTLEGKPQDAAESSYFSWPTARERAELRKKKIKTGNRPQNRGQVTENRGQVTRPFGMSNLSPVLVTPPKVLHVITRMIRGGAQENTLATVVGLRDRGYDVTLATGPSWGREGELLTEALEQGIPVMIFPELTREVRPLKDLLTFFKLSAWLGRNRCAIIHTHTSKAGLLGRLAARLRGIPVIVHTPHGHVFHSYFSPWKERLFLSLERSAAGWTDRLIALTERCRREHVDLGVGRASQWVTIPSGVDESRFQDFSGERTAILASFGIPPERKIVGFVGRLAPVKGALDLVEALPVIFREVPEAHVLLVGDGEDKPVLLERVRALGLTDRVSLAGHREEIDRLMSAMDLLVVPSRNEGMGRVIVEAGFLAKPVVGTAVGGIPDLIEDSETGLLVERRNPPALAHAVVRLLKDPRSASELGRRLREKVLQGFTEAQMAAKIHGLYRETLREKGIHFESEPPREAALSGDRAASG